VKSTRRCFGPELSCQDLSRPLHIHSVPRVTMVLRMCATAVGLSVSCRRTTRLSLGTISVAWMGSSQHGKVAHRQERAWAMDIRWTRRPPRQSHSMSESSGCTDGEPPAVYRGPGCFVAFTSSIARVGKDKTANFVKVTGTCN